MKLCSQQDFRTAEYVAGKAQNKNLNKSLHRFESFLLDLITAKNKEYWSLIGHRPKNVGNIENVLRAKFISLLLTIFTSSRCGQ